MEPEMIEKIAEIATDLKWVKEIVAKIDTKVTKQNGRVRKLENWRWYILGIAAGVAAISGVLFRIIL